MRHSELKEMLLDRNYPAEIINGAINKSRAIPRAIAIKKVARDTSSNRRPVFAVSWDPRLPSVSAISQKHWRSMIRDPLMKETFPEPPLVANKRQKNIGDLTLRAKVSPVMPTPVKRTFRGKV